MARIENLYALLKCLFCEWRGEVKELKQEDVLVKRDSGKSEAYRCPECTKILVHKEGLKFQKTGDALVLYSGNLNSTALLT